jgi:hypothetical protein
MAQNRSRKNAGPPHSSPYVQRKPGRPWIPYELELPEFWDPSLNRPPFLGYYRSLFLDAVTRRAPEVLQSLRTAVWERLGPDTDREELVTQWIEGHLKKQFHLTDDWLRHRVEQALSLWSGDPGWLQDIGWPSINRGWAWSRTLPEKQTTFPRPSLRWDICGEPWSEFEERARAEFDQLLKDYRRRMTGLAVTHGFKKSPRKRSRDDRHPLAAFDWLALWQVCVLTAEQIGAEFDNDLKRKAPTAEAIMDQIRWAADAIELTLRKPTRPGRPPRDQR